MDKNLDISTDPLLLEYLAEDRAESTHLRIKIHIQHYANYLGKPPSIFIKEAWHESKTELPPWERIGDFGFKKKLKGFKEYLEKRKYSENTVKEAITAIRSFHNYYEITPPRTKFQYKETNTTHRVVKKVEDLPGRDEIFQAVTAAKPIMKAIILTMASSGMEASTIRRLTLETFTDSLGDMAITDKNDMLDLEETRRKLERINGPIAMWNVRRKKLGLKGHDYYTLSTPESIDYILDYLEKYPPSSPSDPLFRNRKQKAISEALFTNNFKRVNTLCNFGKLGRYIYFRSHNLRKFFGNMMDPVLGRRDTDYLMGHQREKDLVSRSYYQPDMKALRILYKQHMGKVTITETIKFRGVTADRLIELERRDEERDEEMKQLRKDFDRAMGVKKMEDDLENNQK